MKRRTRRRFDQKLMPVHPLDPLYRSRSRTQNSYRIGSDGIEEPSNLAGQSRRSFGVGIGHENSGERGEWGIEHRSPVSGFARIKVFESLGNRELKCVVIGKVALDHHFPRLIA